MKGQREHRRMLLLPCLTNGGKSRYLLRRSDSSRATNFAICSVVAFARAGEQKEYGDRALGNRLRMLPWEIPRSRRNRRDRRDCRRGRRSTTQADGRAARGVVRRILAVRRCGGSGFVEHTTASRCARRRRLKMAASPSRLRSSGQPNDQASNSNSANTDRTEIQRCAHNTI